MTAGRAPRVLGGLKEIAAVLADAWGRDVSVYQVWRYYHGVQRDPLPVWIHTARVYADEAAVRAWAARQPIWRSWG